MKTIQSTREGELFATRVQFDPDWGEYVVTTYELSTTGYKKKKPVGTYHTDDKADALLTAQVQRGKDKQDAYLRDARGGPDIILGIHDKVKQPTWIPEPKKRRPKMGKG